MRCPHCQFEDSRVLDSRPIEDLTAVRRRRECLKCHARFTTYERLENVPLVVIKKDGTRETFDRHKLLQGMVTACQKRPVSLERLQQAAAEIERAMRQRSEQEISTETIGQLVMDQLRDIDQVAYVRFASVYRQFGDVQHFMDELRPLLKNAPKSTE